MKSETLSLKIIINELVFLRKTVSMKRLKNKDLLLLANKLIEKIPDPCNAKGHYQSFIRKINAKSVEQSKVITHQPKILKTQKLVI